MTPCRFYRSLFLPELYNYLDFIRTIIGEFRVLPDFYVSFTHVTMGGTCDGCQLFHHDIIKKYYQNDNKVIELFKQHSFLPSNYVKMIKN